MPSNGHSLNPLAAAICGSISLGLSIGAATSCSFMTVEALPNDLLEILETSAQRAALSTTVGILCQGDFYDLSKDALWMLSRVFFMISVSLGGLSTASSWAICTVCPPTTGVWHTISMTAALAAVLQVPMFLIFEAEPCAFTTQICRLSTGSYLAIMSVICWMAVTMITQCLDPPIWASNLDQWRVRQDRPRSMAFSMSPANASSDGTSFFISKLRWTGGKHLSEAALLDHVDMTLPRDEGEGGRAFFPSLVVSPKICIKPNTWRSSPRTSEATSVWSTPRSSEPTTPRIQRSDDPYSDSELDVSHESTMWSSNWELAGIQPLVFQREAWPAPYEAAAPPAPPDDAESDPVYIVSMTVDTLAPAAAVVVDNKSTIDDEDDKSETSLGSLEPTVVTVSGDESMLDNEPIQRQDLLGKDASEVRLFPAFENEMMSKENEIMSRENEMMSRENETVNNQCEETKNQAHSHSKDPSRRKRKLNKRMVRRERKVNGYAALYDSMDEENIEESASQFLGTPPLEITVTLDGQSDSDPESLAREYSSVQPKSKHEENLMQDWMTLHQMKMPKVDRCVEDESFVAEQDQSSENPSTNLFEHEKEPEPELHFSDDDDDDTLSTQSRENPPKGLDETDSDFSSQSFDERSRLSLQSREEQSPFSSNSGDQPTTSGPHGSGMHAVSTLRRKRRRRKKTARSGGSVASSQSLLDYIIAEETENDLEEERGGRYEKSRTLKRTNSAPNFASLSQIHGTKDGICMKGIASSYSNSSPFLNDSEPVRIFVSKKLAPKSPLAPSRFKEERTFRGGIHAEIANDSSEDEASLHGSSRSNDRARAREARLRRLQRVCRKNDKETSKADLKVKVNIQQVEDEVPMDESLEQPTSPIVTLKNSLDGSETASVVDTVDLIWAASSSPNGHCQDVSPNETPKQIFSKGDWKAPEKNAGESAPLLDQADVIWNEAHCLNRVDNEAPISLPQVASSASQNQCVDSVETKTVSSLVDTVDLIWAEAFRPIGAEYGPDEASM